MKKCSRCKEIKPLSEFWKNRNNKDGYQYACKDCRRKYNKPHRKNLYNKNKEKEKKAHRELYKVNKDKWENTRLLNTYGISLQDKKDMIRKQKGKCLICKVESDCLHVDHCHSTGKVRGLLCFNCNAMLGSAKDCVRTLKVAITYLKRNKK